MRRPNGLVRRGSLAVLVLLAALLCAGAPARAAAEVHFSPGLRQQVLPRLGAAKRTIDLAMHAFTDSDLAWALVKAKERGVRIRVYLDGGQEKARFAKGRFLAARGVAVRYYRGSGLMHHKFAVIDRRLVLTGSYNWTASGDESNQENLLVLADRPLAEQYRRAFEKLWQRPE